jgi:hypothetical protein
MSDYLFDTDLIARLVFALLPHKPPYRLALDRTNWKFGTTNINVLVLAIVYHGVAFPFIFTMMPKFGNSSTEERIELMQRYINLFGADTIECLLADREFVGDHLVRLPQPPSDSLSHSDKREFLGRHSKKWSSC